MIEGSEEWRGDEGGGDQSFSLALGENKRNRKTNKKKATDGFNAADFGSSTWPDATKIY